MQGGTPLPLEKELPFPDIGEAELLVEVAHENDFSHDVGSELLHLVTLFIGAIEILQEDLYQITAEHLEK